MKYFLIALLFFLNLSITLAQHSITIDIENLKRPEKPLPTTSFSDILKDMIRTDSGYYNQWPRPAKEPNYDVVAKSEIKGELVDLKYHPFFEGMHIAYAEHRPFTLSPDAVWLLICQGFAQHVNNNSEALRHFFVDFQGRGSLVIQNGNIDLDNPKSPWNEALNDFSKQINLNVKGGLAETMTANFSTTTPITRIASQVTLMNTVKSYFEFVMIYLACGIPAVTIQGTPEDWQKIEAKTENLRKYDLGWWVDALEPVLKKITAASAGRKDKVFWRNMFNIHRGALCEGKPDSVNGWIVKFFPYDKYGKRNNLNVLLLKDVLPKEVVQVDVKYINLLPDGSEETTPLELWAGFVGLKQDRQTFNLEPTIGWMIRKKSSGGNATLIAGLKAANTKREGLPSSDGIDIRVKKVPLELTKIGRIHKLTIRFINEVDIPDELSKVQIDSLELWGEIDQSGIERICRLFPHTYLIINNHQYTNGKTIEVIR